MKRNIIAALAATTLVLSACGGSKTEESVIAEPTVTLDTIDQRLSYIVGTNMAKQFSRDGVELDVAALSLAIADAKADKPSQISDEEVAKTIAALQERAQAKQKADAEALTEKNKTEGAAYLAENGKKEGVITTESGLQYKEVTAGEGAKPTAEDTVTVHYKGTLVDGTVFDSSYDRGEPASFPVGGVIPGWVEALQLMNIGDKFELAIPSELAYGPGGTGQAIGPHAALLFEVELIAIAEKPAEEKK